MPRNDRSRRIEQHEDLAAQLSAARSAQARQILKLRTATDRSVLRLAALLRTPEQMAEMERLTDLLLDLWPEVVPQAIAQEAAHELVKELRRSD